MKECNTCLESKPVDDFYRHPKMADGSLGRCKECHKAAIKYSRESRLDYYQAYDRARGRLFHRKAAVKERAPRYYHLQAAWIKRNPEKRRAHCALNNAVRDGRISRLPCCQCGCKDSHGHHADYSKPLDVVWLCASCHAAEHLDIKRPQGRQNDISALTECRPYNHTAILSLLP